jgi:hypothetical protein
VTSGTSGTSGNPASPYTGNRSYRSWNGGDGKYEISSGRYRPKWNSYSTDNRRLSSQVSYWTYLCPNGHTVSNVYAPTFNYYNNSLNGSNLPVISTSDKNAVLKKILDKAKGHSFNAGVNLAQMGQVSSMVSSNLGKLGRSVMALKRGDFATAARQLGASPRTSKLKPSDVSGRWLELQYGWLPTLSDSYEAAKAFEAISAGPQSTRFRSSVVYHGDATWGGPHATLQIRLKQSRTYQLTYELEEELSFSRQLGLLDPLSIAWEMIPYSFVVDWFIPIGTYLETLNQASKLKGRWMISESKTTSMPVFEKSGAAGGNPFCPTHGTKRLLGPISKPVVSYSRIENTRSVTFSPPKVSLPNFVVGGAVHGRRVWNAIALAQQRFLS